MLVIESKDENIVDQVEEIKPSITSNQEEQEQEQKQKETASIIVDNEAPKITYASMVSRTFIVMLTTNKILSGIPQVGFE